VDGNVVVSVDGERFHVSALFPVAYSRMDIHHSGRGHKQGNSAGNQEGDGKAMGSGAAR
jgi:hypothetical protein